MKKISLKEIGLKNLVLLLVSGIALILLTVPGLFQGGKETEGTVVTASPTAAPTPLPPEPTEEERLKNLLSKISGVGKTEVMIIYESSQEEIVLKDSDITVLTSVVSGIVVVAEGGGNGVTATYISNAVEALFELPKHKIIVLPME